jgi:hypothetical protein
MPPNIPSEILDGLRNLTREWVASEASERQLFQPWLARFCEVMDLPRPGSPPTDDDSFERPVKVIGGDSRESTNFIDYWKAGYVAVEAKASGIAASNDLLLRNAFNQLKRYVAFVGSRPPYLIVVDVPGTLVIWDGWRGEYGDFAAGRRIALSTLHERPDDIALLRDVFSNPSARDPRGRAQAVTREIAAKLATLAATFEGRGLDSERVARFLMRCVFCFFAEDVELLPKDLFKRTLETARSSGDPARVGTVLTSLWRTMDEGGMFGAELLHRFNGHFFNSVEALPLESADVSLLIEAAQFDWSAVEPSIFGTLLVRALDPVERHRLGAEYTPREYIERLIEPTVVEPIRERWTAVTAAVVQLEETGKKKDREKALEQLREFHGWLRGLLFLDPACGSGNFLYVTMAAVKRIELEVFREIERIRGREGTEQTEQLFDEVHPRQFHGIEIKPWAREIAELTLWIGYHQFWREAHGGRTPPDPILEDTGTIQQKDSVMSTSGMRRDPTRSEPDLTPRIVHPVSGMLVPDPSARRDYELMLNPRRTEWPRADFIFGNPPYIGGTSMRGALGSGYVDALRETYRDADPEGWDYVMYWWLRAAEEVASGRTMRAGLITTNSISQRRNRGVITAARLMGASVVWAIADHPWVDDIDGAAVRVAMTVLSRPGPTPRIAVVEDAGRVAAIRDVSQINDDLTGSADLATAALAPVTANQGLSSNGFNLRGSGFMVSSEEARQLIDGEPRNAQILKRYRNGKDLTDRPREMWLIDFDNRSEAAAREYPQLFDIIRTRVLPERSVKKEKSARDYWWRLWRTRPELRRALVGLPRYVATPETAKHRFFLFLGSDIAPDHALVAIALADAHYLGVLSSRIHATWSLGAGTRLGVGNDPRYNKSVCFDPFPFPEPSPDVRVKISALAERLDQHRTDAIARDEKVTMTGMYNVVEKLRSGAALTAKERSIHEVAACGVLRDLHGELDALVAQAYGWPWPLDNDEILDRLVKLHDQRVEEEKGGLIRWLRPEYQVPRSAPKNASAELDLPEVAVSPAVDVLRPWPASAVEQLAAISAVLGGRSLTAADVIAAFDGAKRDLVTRHLDTLALMGEVTIDDGGRYATARKAA